MRTPSRILASLLLVLVAVVALAGPSGASTSGPDARSVERLYRAYFLRAPDDRGLAYWQTVRASGVPLTTISDSFAASEEFRLRYGTLDRRAFVDRIYRNVLGRPANASGLGYWTEKLRIGALDRGGVMLQFSDSAEFKDRTGVVAALPTAPTGAGDPAGRASVPAEADLAPVGSPDQVVGDGRPSSCTSSAVVAAVARGGTIVFDCGPDPVTIAMTETARIRNDADPDVVIDGGGLVTLSGMGQRRILYMNTCDRAQVWTTPHCQDQDHPRLVVQRLTFVDGDATGLGDDSSTDGGGAIFVRGGTFRIVDSVFRDNVCDATGPDVGGGAVRVLSQHQGAPVAVTRSTFTGNRCANGGATSGIGTSWDFRNSVFADNHAIGVGANPQRPGTPGGGNGGSIYGDGNRFTIRVLGTTVLDSTAREGGGAIFFVSNDRSGTLHIEQSTFRRNVSEGFETRGLPGSFFLGAGAWVSGTTFG